MTVCVFSLFYFFFYPWKQNIIEKLSDWDKLLGFYLIGIKSLIEMVQSGSYFLISGLFAGKIIKISNIFKVPEFFFSSTQYELQYFFLNILGKIALTYYTLYILVYILLNKDDPVHYSFNLS